MGGTAIKAATGILALLAAAAPTLGSVEGVLVGNGDKVTASVDDASDTDAFTVGLGAGGKLSVTAAAAKGTALLPSIRLFDPAGGEVAVGTLVKGAGKPRVSLRNFVVPAGGTGPWRVVISGAAPGAYTASFGVKDPRTVVRKLLPVPAGQEVVVPVPTAAGAILSGKVTVKSGPAPAAALFREDEGGAGGEALVLPSYSFTRAAGTDAPVDTRVREASAVVLEGAAGADGVVDLLVKVKLPKALKRRVVLAPEGGVAGAAPGSVRQEQAVQLTLDGNFLQGALPPRVFATLPGEDAADGGLAVTASAYAGASTPDPDSAVTLRPAATVDFAVAADAAYGGRDLVYVPPPLLGEPARLPGAFLVRAPVPTVTGVGPAFVRQEDASVLLTVTGTGFRAGGSLSFSGTGIAAGSTTVVSATTATVTVSVDAAAAVGTRDVAFTQPVAGGGSTGTGAGLLGVRHPIPTVASAAPPVVRQGDTGVVLTITGTGFRSGGTVSVSGTGVASGAATVVDATTATAAFTATAGAAIGARDVTWTQPAAGGGDAATGTGILTVNYPDPVVSSVSPTFVRQLEAGTTLTVTGGGFRAAGTLSFTGTGLAVGPTTVISDTTATVTVSVDEFAAVGARDATFTQDAVGGGAAGTKVGGLAVQNPVPALTSVSPVSITQGDSGVAFTLTGNHFRDGGVVAAGSGITVTGGTRNSNTEFVATIAADALALLGAHDVTYAQPAAGGSASAVKAGGLQVNAPAPTVTSVSPAVVRQGDAAVARTLAGTNFRSGGTLAVAGTGVTVGSVVVTSAAQVDFTLTAASNAPIGARDVTWTQPAAGGGASATKTGGVTVNFPNPTIASVSPSYVEVGTTGQTLTVTGTGFRTGGTLSVSGAGVAFSSPAFVNETTYTVSCTVDVAAALTFRDVTFTHDAAGGGASTTKTSALEVRPVGPVVTALAPEAWLPGTARFRCVATGLNFNSGTATSVSGTGVTVHSTTFDSTTKLTLELTVDSAAAIGARDLVVTPGAGGGPAKTFTGAVKIAAAPPEVASFSAPTLAQGASSVSVTVLGSGFRPGDALSASGSGVAFSSVSIVNEGKITATAAVTALASTGSRNALVTRSTGDGGLSGTLAAAFKVIGATPTLTAVNPSKAGRTGSGGATREVPVTLTGTNFMTGATLSATKTSGTGVSVVSSSERVVSDTQMTATLSITGTATTGAWDLQVANPSTLGNSGTGGNGLLDVKDENTLAVNRVIASSGAAYGGERVTVEGSGFTTGATADFGTVTAAGTYVLDKNTVVTTVPAPSAQSSSAVRVVDVKVTNPSGGGSATLTGGYAYEKDDLQFRVRSIFPAQDATAVPKNLVSAVARLSAPADATTGTYGSTTGTHCFWFESGGSLVTSGSRGFGPGGRTLVFSRSGGGNLAIANAGKYVLDVPTTLKSLGGNALSVMRIGSTTHDQYTFTISSSATDTTAPTATITPSSGSTGVDVTAKPKIVFSEEIDPLTLNLTNVTFQQGATTVGADLALADDLKTVTVTPLGTLAASTTYTTTVTGSVKDLFGNAFSSTSYTFTTGNGTDGTAPVIEAAVLESLPASMDGSGTYVNSSGTGGNAFDPYLPRDGWLVDVRYSDEGGSGIDTTTFSAKASVTVGGNSANAELASNFRITPTGASWRIPSTGFTAGDDATFTFAVKDRAGTSASSLAVTLDAISKDTTATNGGDHDPHDSRRTWILRGDIDGYTATFSTQASPALQGVTTTATANGIPDLDESLRLVGLNSGSMTAAAAGTTNGNETGTNAIVKRMFLERLRESLRERFHVSEDGVHDADSVDVEFLLPGEQGSLASMPSYSTSNSFNSSKAFSEISVGGTLGADSSAFGLPGTLGQAWFDPRNTVEEANLNFGTGNITGIYLTGMLKLQVNSDTTNSVFGSRVSAKFVAIHGGTPVGEDALDDDVLAGTFDRTSASNTSAQNARYDAIQDAVELTALYAGAVTAHEVGHSTGLVEDGAPKRGLFGNAHFSNAFTEATSTSTNTSHHLNFLGNDIMAASTDFESAVVTGTDFKRFSPMDIAYLRNRLVYDEGK